MSSAVAELETGLQGMLALKAPGVSGSRIATITALCVANVQSESVLIQKLYTHFKKTPPTHKLGVLYVVDSVTRKWLDQAKQQGQTVNSSAPDGTFAAGVNRVTELIPVLMNDIISSAPGDQKEKIRKLVDIWEKGQTFPSKLLESFKDKLNAPPPNQSTTPPGSPPPTVLGGSRNSQQGAPAIPANIMETLANLARHSTTVAQSISSIVAPAVPAAAPAAPAAPYSLPGPPSNPAIPPHLVNQMPPQPGFPFLPTSLPASQPVNAPAALPFQIPPPAQSGQYAPASVPLAASSQATGFPGNPPPLPAAGNVDPKVQQQLLLIQALVAQGLSIDQITAVVTQMTGNNNATLPAPSAASGAAGATVPPPFPGQNGYAASAPPADWNASRVDGSRDRNYPDPRSPGRTARGRSRSRSPGRHWDSRGSPRGRDDRGGYGEYGRRSPPPAGRGRPDDRERGRGRGRGSDYRQRSPPGRRGSSPQHDMTSIRQPGEKWIQHDPSLPSGHIRVLSRTLFVGGVTVSEAELRSIFSRYGEVQTCIVNKEKRHAFVKMYTRKDAVAAKEAMEDARPEDNGLRTRWGVGFGPRDCSDYATGISVIPISKLTDADKKWMLSAPWGGSGGKPITSGMVVEEPDIEIGAGVSSKAISRRMQTDRGGLNGPRSSRRDDDNTGHSGGGGSGGEGHSRGGHGGGRSGRRGGGIGRDNRRDDERHDDGSNNQPAIPGFPFGITMGPNGMPIFPPGFAFPAPDGQNNNHNNNY